MCAIQILARTILDQICCAKGIETRCVIGRETQQVVPEVIQVKFYAGRAAGAMKTQ